MLTISNGIGAVFNLIMGLFAGAPLLGMIVISVVTGVIMLIIYKYTSNQAGITRAKDRIKANFLAIMLYKDSFRVLLISIARILRWNLSYMGHNLKPLAVMMAPVLLLLVQLNFWYGYEPLGVDRTAMVTATVADKVDMYAAKPELTTPEGVVVETGGVRNRQAQQVSWRIRGKVPGDYTLHLSIGGVEVDKRVVVGDTERLHHLIPKRHDGNFWDGLLYPGAPKLEGGITQIDIAYPIAEMNVFGWHIHWIIVYFVLSIIAGLSMKGVFGVDI